MSFSIRNVCVGESWVLRCLGVTDAKRDSVYRAVFGGPWVYARRGRSFGPGGRFDGLLLSRLLALQTRLGGCPSIPGRVDW